MSSSSESSHPGLAAALADLFGRTAAGIKLDLLPIRACLNALRGPQRRYPSVLIAGTNGKGTAARTLATALNRGKSRAGLYTSPHLLRFSERIQIAGEEISAGDIVRLHRRVVATEPALARPLTFFEATTAMALLAFSEASVDIAVLEVGLGGRLDATAAVEPVVAVITRIDLDHTRWLGDSLELIAREKGAILPHRGVAIVTPQHPEARRVLEAMAAERHTTLVWTSHAEDGSELVLSARGDEIRVPRPAAPFFADSLAAAWGAYQTLSARGLGVSTSSFVEGVAGATHRGRYEWHGDNLVLDAAHNPAALEALGAALAADPRAGRPRHVVFGCLADKDAAGMLQRAQRFADALYLASLPMRRGASAQTLAAHAPQARVFASPPAALAAAQQAAAAQGGLVVVTGSIFLVSEALGVLTDEPRDPPVAG